MRYVMALDLIDDAKRIADYEKAHQTIWPEVRDHLRAHGIVTMEIYRLGTRMCMVMEVDPEIYDADAMLIASRNDPAIAQWEALMWTYQAPTPWTGPGRKWIPMTRIFNLSAQ